jgi:tryptophanyl-tRNA synthetase
MENRKPIIFSGIQPSGDLHLGNYIGAIRSWVAMQDDYQSVFSIVDLHAITVRQDPTELRKSCLDLLAQYIAFGIDPDKNILFMQSHVTAHAELAWILDCFTYFGELSRMTQFKDKSRKNAENINAGLFTYPVLMAADILLYQAELVPVGDDQKQHVEITRDIAERCNALWGDVFTMPDVFIPKVGARIMSLTDPTSKMSKSEADKNSLILMRDDADAIRRKLRRAVTDLGNEIVASPDKPGVTNLLSIYCACSGETLDAAQNRFAGQGYGAFKDAVADAVIATLTPMQAEFKRIRADKAFLQDTMQKGAERASRIANRTLNKVRRKVGLAPYEL